MVVLFLQGGEFTAVCNLDGGFGFTTGRSTLFQFGDDMHSINDFTKDNVLTI